MDFRIVLFENEGYATARGDKGVQDILASSADAGYIKDGTYPIIFRLHPYCWKWWISPKQEEMNFSMFTPDSWLDRPLWKNKPIQQRLIAALKDWQKKYLRLLLQPAKCLAVQNPVPVPLKHRTDIALRLLPLPPSGIPV